MLLQLLLNDFVEFRYADLLKEASRKFGICYWTHSSWDECHDGVVDVLSSLVKCMSVLTLWRVTELTCLLLRPRLLRISTIELSDCHLAPETKQLPLPGAAFCCCLMLEQEPSPRTAPVSMLPAINTYGRTRSHEKD